MSSRDSIIRTANSLSLAAWFGGSLMGLVSLPKAASAPHDGDSDTVHSEGSAWSAWQPVQSAAIVSQLASGAALTVTNAHRVLGQRGVARTSIVRTALTGVAIGATALAARSGKQLEQAISDRDSDDSSPSDDEVAGLERRTRALQAAVPVLTGALIAMDSLMGEQQRPARVLRGTAQRLLPDAVADRIAA